MSARDGDEIFPSDENWGQATWKYLSCLHGRSSKESVHLQIQRPSNPEGKQC